MHQIFTIARFELAKKKVAAKPGAIIGLLVVFILFTSAFFLLSHAGFKPTHKYYSITESGGALDSYIDASDSLRISSNAPVSVFLRTDESYVLSANQQFVGTATVAAISDMLKSQNRYLLLSSGIQPPFLILLNVTKRAREEILQPIVHNQTQSQDSFVRLGEKVTPDNEIDSLIAQGVSGESSIPSIVAPDGSTVLASQQLTRPSEVEPVSDKLDVDTLRKRKNELENTALISQASIPKGLEYPGDVSTLSAVKDLFIIIQLMLVFNFFSALLGNSFFEEKLNYRSSLLFSMPMPKRFVIVGKLLPYLLLSMFFACLLLWLQYPFLLLQPIVYVLLLVLALCYFSLSFLNGLLSRSNKEYSFLNVFTTAILSLYLLIPAFIANYSTLGYASLLTPVLFMAQKQIVSISLILFLATIYAALAFVVFFLGSTLWNFEHLYTYTSPLKKLQYILRINTNSAWQFFVYGICCVPFLWLAQIVMIALFLLIPFENKLFLFLFGAAFCEEFVRTLVVRAHIAYKRASPIDIKLPMTRFKRSLAVGLGFGLAEKLILLVAIAPYLEGYQFIVTAGVIIPIILHTALTYLFSYLVEKFDWCARHATVVCVGLGLVHATFNFIVITLTGVTLI